MRVSRNRKSVETATVLVRAALGLALVAGAGTPRALAQAQEPVPRPDEATTRGVSATVWSAGAEAAQLPQDIRIMQRIVSTALGEVEPPELPDALKPDAEASGADRPLVFDFGDFGTNIRALAGSGSRVYSIGGRDVTGFYMQGYGYLFTVKWRVGPRGLSSGMAVERMAELVGQARRAAASGEEAEARAAGEAERTLEQRRQELEERQAAWQAWSDEYRDLLAGALRQVVAVYGSTLKRAAPEESITFIADFGGGDDQTVTVTARRGELTGVNRDRNLEVVQMARGEPGISDTLRTELKIMAEIIDGSLQVEGTGGVWAPSGELVRYFGGDSSYQRVPGYGVLFRKSARLNLATRVIQRANASRRGGVEVAPSFRQTIDESTEEQRQAYADHLADLKRRTAGILATYGPTLTELGADEWVGVYYNVGSAAGLLEGGISNFLVQARMRDIREAGNQPDGADWLLDRLVTNEKQD